MFEQLDINNDFRIQTDLLYIVVQVSLLIVAFSVDVVPLILGLFSSFKLNNELYVSSLWLLNFNKSSNVIHLFHFTLQLDRHSLGLNL